MWWLRVTALLLLTLSPLSSSNVNQSSSIPPSPTLPTNDDSYETPSLPNSPDNSTILADSVENETSSTVSIVDNSTAQVQKSTAPIGSSELEKEQQGTEIEDSSTLNGLDSTPSEEEYDDEKDEAGSSQVVGPQAEPSQLGSDVESQPQSGESSSAQTNNTENYDGLSSDKLKIELDKATKELNEAKDATRKANEKLDEKKKAAEQPNKDYEEKKKKWEKLEAIAVEKETAEREYNEASKNLTVISRLFKKAERELNRTTKELERAKKIEEEMGSWDNLLQDAKTKEASKKSEVQPLRDRLASDETEKDTKLDLWTDAINAVKPTQATYDVDKCDEPPQSTSSLCVRIRNERDRLNNLADQAKNVYDTAELSFNTTQKALDDLLKEISSLEAEITRLKNNIDEFTPDIINERINKLKGELKDRNENYDNVKSKKEEAESELAKKKTAKEEAEQSDGGISTQTARTDEIRAKAILDEASEVKAKADKEVDDQEKILNKAKESETKLKDKVDLLDKKYAEARKKEETKSGSLGLYIGLPIGIFLLIAGIAVGAFFVWRKKFKKRETVIEKKAQPAPAHVVNKTQPQTVPTIQKKKDKKIITKQPGVANSTSQSTASNTSNRQNGNNQGEVVAAIPTELEVEYMEGDKPVECLGPIGKYIPCPQFKIPAKLFKWKGPLPRPTRWHGDPKHDLDGKNLPDKLEHLYIDPNAMYASEIGAGEIMEDGGPPSDSDRSEYLNYANQWEDAKAAKIAWEEAENKPNQTEEDKKNVKKLEDKFLKLDELRAKEQKKHSKNRSPEQSSKEPSRRDKSPRKERSSRKKRARK